MTKIVPIILSGGAGTRLWPISRRVHPKPFTVALGQKLSLQYHHKRAEHWVVAQGKAMVQTGDEEFETGPGEYRYIPLGEKHRLTNIGNT